MSERMIELHRAKLGLVSSPSSQTAAASPNKQRPGAGGPKLTPKEAAKAAMLAEDSMMEAFIDRLQKRDDSQQMSMLMLGSTAAAAETTNATNTAAAASTTMGMGSDGAGPTVPTALSRRMLQRQGVGYLDGTVASVVSASADRFLATVLQQSIACRDQRLNGARMAKKAERDRKRHQRHYKADVDDRKRRKAEIEKARETVALQAIQVAEGVRKENQSRASAAVHDAAAAAKGETVKRKKRPPSASASPANGVKIDPVLKKLAEEDENEDGYDSIDEEEEYYQQKMGGLDVDDDDHIGEGNTGGDDDVDKEDDDDDDDDDDDEEEDVTLLLRDIVRPLEAWDFRLAGKETLPTQPAERHGRVQNDDDDDDDDDDELDDKDSDSVQQAEMDIGNDDAMNGINGDKVPSTNGS
eukprot:CAMPEP_0113496620 /NCGR_PEP_ID=MMETSP0014_2-20120614/30215_1 /TAXON_ID=2857 /ORGANISM="Nitzschia sp." /LENGTH=411 /DNA_ID=CAMNT_0000390547 /DNA_START=1619 /DNA_END=2854 /DNA_ORIENTATION=- /assembly_acc=CAM_ASM_000159